MKVIQKGSGQKGWSKRKTCTGQGNGEGGCGAILLVEEADMFITQSHAHMDTDSFVTFKCPECGVLTDFDDNEAPHTLVRSLPGKKKWEAANPA